MNLNLSFTDDNFAILAFNQPDRKVNVLTRSLWTDFKAALGSIYFQGLNGLIVKSAKPGCFLAGADLKEFFPATQDDEERYLSFTSLGSSTLSMLQDMRFPTYAMVEGVCLGGGLEVALACDGIYLRDDNRLQVGFPEVNLGLIPGWGGTQRLSRVAGVQQACKWIGETTILTNASKFWQGCTINSDTDEEVVRRIKDDCLDEGLSIALRERKFSEVQESGNLEVDEPVPPADPRRIRAFASVIDVIRSGGQTDLFAGLRMEQEAFVNLIPSPEAQELMGEFFHRKK